MAKNSGVGLEKLAETVADELTQRSWVLIAYQYRPCPSSRYARGLHTTLPWAAKKCCATSVVRQSFTFGDARAGRENTCHRHGLREKENVKLRFNSGGKGNGPSVLRTSNRVCATRRLTSRACDCCCAFDGEGVAMRAVATRRGLLRRPSSRWGMPRAATIGLWRWRRSRATRLSTGGSQGIGRATAAAMLKRGARVTLLTLRAKRAPSSCCCCSLETGESKGRCSACALAAATLSAR